MRRRLGCLRLALGAALAGRFAAYIDRYPGCSTAALHVASVGKRADRTVVASARRLIEDAGYRLAWPCEPVDSWWRATVDDVDLWWPSAARCAELARTATGERQERLLHGMLL